MKEKYITKEELWEKETIQKIAVTNYAKNLKMKLQCN